MRTVCIPSVYGTVFNFINFRWKSWARSAKIVLELEDLARSWHFHLWSWFDGNIIKSFSGSKIVFQWSLNYSIGLNSFLIKYERPYFVPDKKWERIKSSVLFAFLVSKWFEVFFLGLLFSTNTVIVITNLYYYHLVNVIRFSLA